METSTAAAPHPLKYAFIDAARGYAILLVMICHTVHPNLPWPLRRTLMLGWHGVQLFFVVSCLTLAMSWHERQGREARPIAGFMTRRVFRIAPMYLVALLLYGIVTPPGDGFSLGHLFATILFLHGWSPGLMPTVEGAWSAVPGSWSVAVEFGFYALFASLAAVVSNLSRAVIGVFVAVLFAGLANNLAMDWYGATYGFKATDQFLYYWLPNQMPVFICGFVAYFALRHLRPGGDWAFAGGWIGRHATLIALVSTGLFFALGYTTISRLPSLRLPFLPIHLIASLFFLVAVVALGLASRSLFINRPIVMLGRVSFSAYLLHFAVLALGERWLVPVFMPSATGIAAIFHDALSLVFVVTITFMLSTMAFRFVEQPMIRLGGDIARRVGKPFIPQRSAQSGIV